MSFNFIYNPLSNEKYSIFSYEGKSLLKQYIKDYQTGGSGSVNPKTLDDFIAVEGAKVDKLNECETKLNECDGMINKYRIAYETIRRAALKQRKQFTELKSKLQTMETQPTRAKSVEQKENDEGGEPTNPYEFTIEANTFKMGRFEVVLTDENKLGSGGSKTIYKLERGEETFALAKIPKDGLNKEVQNEINCLRKLDHPNIAKLYGDSKDANFHYLLMEYGESDLISKRGKALDDIELTRRFIINMASAISHLKKNNINHRDIKLENFIIVGKSPNQVVKLIDFGISTRCPGTEGYSKKGNPMDVRKPDGPQKMFSSGGGTVFYVAPENARGEPSVNTHPGDVFALGLCILELFYEGDTKVLPVYSQLALNVGAVENRIKTNFPGIGELEEFYTKINKHVFGGKPIIQRMLNQIPTERKIEEVLEALGVSEEDETEGDGGGK